MKKIKNYFRGLYEYFKSFSVFKKILFILLSLLTLFEVIVAIYVTPKSSYFPEILDSYTDFWKHSFSYTILPFIVFVFNIVCLNIKR